MLAVIQRHCAYRGWNLLAAHVRSNHVHIIVEAETRPEKIMNEFKAYASRELNQSGNRGIQSETLGAAWKHPLAMEGRGC